MTRKLFEKQIPEADARVYASTFGGGWIVPLTPEGERSLGEFFGEEPGFLAPIGLRGFIVEPHMAEDLAARLTAEELTWSVDR
jgi:hypothetical protein